MHFIACLSDDVLFSLTFNNYFHKHSVVLQFPPGSFINIKHTHTRSSGIERQLIKGAICNKVDLENYDKCHELRSAFMKKNRLVLIRAAKSGNKVHDVKFQAQNLEEKEAWIKAFSDGINRAKNKIFDECGISIAWSQTSLCFLCVMLLNA
uniref:PH domain-containing protein n=1 Tax=Hucho hucho TaxID=62062 RepID=A0A4W5Q342_9TELE